MVSLTALIPSLVTDLVYGTPRNFTHTVLYTHPLPYMRRDAATALVAVQQELAKQGLGLKVYDAFRPFSVSCKMWRLVPDKRYVANPAKGSKHNRGLAVDITIIDLNTGKELNMGTAFDNFTDTAHHDFVLLPEKVLVHRKLLKRVMWKHGFTPVPTEWWHYNWRTNEEFEVIDLDFDQVKDALKK